MVNFSNRQSIYFSSTTEYKPNSIEQKAAEKQTLETELTSSNEEEHYMVILQMMKRLRIIDSELRDAELKAKDTEMEIITECRNLVKITRGWNAMKNLLKIKFIKKAK